MSWLINLMEYVQIYSMLLPLLNWKKSCVHPWFNDESRAIRQKWRRAERKWKRDKLQISYDYVKECMIHYQKTVKIVMANYFSDLIAKIAHSPKILFNTINIVLNPMSNVYPDPSPMACENFLKFFTDKINVIRCVLFPPLWTSLSPYHYLHIYLFTPVTWCKLFIKWSPTFCSLDVIPSFLL